MISFLVENIRSRHKERKKRKIGGLLLFRGHWNIIEMLGTSFVTIVLRSNLLTYITRRQQYHRDKQWITQ